MKKESLIFIGIGAALILYVVWNRKPELDRATAVYQSSLTPWQQTKNAFTQAWYEAPTQAQIYDMEQYPGMTFDN